MLDRKFIFENAAAVAENCRNRGIDADIDRFTELENQRRELDAEVQELNRQANDVSKSIGKAKDDAEREERKAKGRELREAKEAKQQQLQKIVAELELIHAVIPNMTHPDAPIGTDEAANKVIGNGSASVTKFDFTPKDHVDLAESLDLLDLEAGSRVAGHGFYYLKNDAVLLELALIRYALDLLIPAGYTPTTTPDLALNDVLGGTGFNPRGPETQIYSVEKSDLSLIATAEITLAGLYAKQTLDEEQLPIRLAGISHCFRTEAGAHGRATRGLYRVHQFTKVEMFAFTTADQSDAMHEELRSLECQVFDGLGIPYQIIDTATGDLGGPAYRKYDLEAWMPGRGDGGEYGEVTSTSNCTDYQARRLSIRYKRKGEKGTHFVHTLNGTAVAISRAIIAILENYQQADGTIRLPEALVPYMGKEAIAPR
ncbi:MAG: serine--tRNA ligase [Pirellulales bacterium]|nr:serine--tRNA ligase [Pirellulales bacterium]